MKKFLIALALLALGTTAFAQYGGSTGPQYTWPKDNFLMGMMGPAGATLNPFVIGPKPSGYTTGYTFTGAAPSATSYTLSWTMNGYTQEYFTFSGTTIPTSALNLGNLASFNYYLCSTFESGAGNYDCTDQIGSPPAGRSFIKDEQSAGYGQMKQFYTSNAAGSNAKSGTFEFIHSFPYTRIEMNATTSGVVRRNTFIMQPNGGVSTYLASHNIVLEGSYAGGTRFAAMGLNATNPTFTVSLQYGAGTSMSLNTTTFAVNLPYNSLTMNYQYFRLTAPADLQKTYLGWQILTDYSGVYTYSLVGGLPDSGSGKLTVTITDTDASVTTGDVDICGRTTQNVAPGSVDKFECETVAITGVGTFDTVNSYYQVVSVKSSSVTTLSVVPDETIAVTWKAPATGYGPLEAVQLVSQTKLQIDANSMVPAYNGRALCTDLSLGCDLLNGPGGSTEGDRFRFILSPYGGAVSVVDGGNFVLSGNFSMAGNDVLDLVYDALESKWVEIGRSDN